MNQPFYFGVGERRLFGIYTPPSSRPQRRGVVLCYPWGQEYVRAHRSFRVLADALAARGLHVLRFDYYGTGDSAGEGHEVDLDGWRHDVASAVVELQSISRVGRVGLAGLRLGATLAAAAADLEPRVRRVGFWDPIVDGRSYVEELRQAAWPVNSERMSPSPAADAGGPVSGVLEVDGFPLTETFMEELTSIRSESYAVRPSLEILLAVTERTRLTDLLRTTLEERFDSRLHYVFRPEPPSWKQQLDYGAGAVPATLIDSLSSWEW